MTRTTPLQFAIIATVLLLAAAGMSADFQPERITNVSVRSPSAGSNPEYLQAGPTQMFFHASDSVHGTELWVSDGTAAGTTLTKDIYIGDSSSVHGSGLGIFHSGLFYFQAHHISYGDELFISDGTPGGTQLVRDINPGFGSSNPSNFVVNNGSLYFSADDGTTFSIWISDGTEVGTQPIITPACTGTFGSYPFASYGGQIYFMTRSSGVAELWKTNGTCAGSTKIYAFPPGISGYVYDSIEFGSYLYFQLDYTLWRTDGTDTGTTRVVNGSVSSIEATSTTLYYSTGSELHATDGFTYNTLIDTGSIQSFKAVNQKAYYTKFNTQFQLYETDGTLGGTQLVHSTGRTTPIYHNGYFYFAATDTSGTELWRNDGTSVTNALVKDLKPGSASSDPNWFTEFNGTLYFAADGPNGRELWRTDGTDIGTTIVADIAIGLSGLNPQSFCDMGTFALLSGNYPGLGSELWRSDGSEVGTTLVKDINPGSLSSSPETPVVMNGVAYFAATKVDTGKELWRSDGTEAGTYIVKDITPGGNWSSPGKLYVCNNLLFFSVGSSSAYQTPWVSNGTEAGTFKLAEINIAPPTSSPGLFTPYKGELYFRADDSAHGIELWKTDGTPAGTQLAVDILPGTASGKPWQLLPIGDTLFLQAYDPVHNYELWKSDGTPEGTVLLKDLNPGSTFGIPDFLTNWNNTLYFEAYKTTYSYTIWRSDGTEQGTVQVIDVGGGIPHTFTPGGDKMYFCTDDYVYRTDGTQAGTQLICSIYEPQHYAANLVYYNGWLFHQRYSAGGRELWAINCVNDTPQLVHDFMPGFYDSFAKVLGQSNGKIFVSAKEDYGNGIGAGYQLWTLTPPPNFPTAAADWQLYQ